MNGPPSSPIRVPLLAASLLFTAFVSSALGEEQGQISLDARFAAGEALRGRRPAALRVDLSNRGPTFEGRLRFTVKGRRESRVLDVKVPTRSVRRYFLPLDPGSPGFLSGELCLETPGGGEVLATGGTLRARVSGMHCIMGVVGNGRILGLRKILAKKSLRALNLHVPIPPSELPEIWEGLAPYDVLFVWGSDFRNFSGAQISALRNWV
ncbi:MAG: hypothetical protein ACYTFG_17585, partial [Planctomycetota bacterium]